MHPGSARSARRNSAGPRVQRSSETTRRFSSLSEGIAQHGRAPRHVPARASLPRRRSKPVQMVASPPDDRQALAALVREEQDDRRLCPRDCFSTSVSQGTDLANPALGR
jgi:hypothetical protein